MSDKLFGFIEKKADFASLIALAISIVAGLYQLYWYLEKSDVTLLQPQQVFFNKMERRLVRIVIPITFHNESTVQYNEIIRKIDARLRFLGTKDVTVDYTWRSFAAFDPLQRSGQSLLLTGLVAPILVPGASSTSHEIEFYQPDKQCVDHPCGKLMVRLMEWVDFARLAAESEQIRLNMTAFGVEGEKYSATCTLIIDEAFIERVNDPKPWHAPPCIEPTLNGL